MISALLSNIKKLEALAEERLAQRRADDSDRLFTATQLVRYGVCLCTCHTTDYTTHSGVACCALAKTQHHLD
jgi:hypothetical protein